MNGTRVDPEEDLQDLNGGRVKTWELVVAFSLMAAFAVVAEIERVARRLLGWWMRLVNRSDAGRRQ